MILVIDNYDSFVFNVVRYFEELGEAVAVARNDALDTADIRAKVPDAVVISPGPCTPAEAGVSLPAIRDLSGTVPILGVCLGHQAIGAAFGGKVERAIRPLHGQATPVRHDGTGLFSGIPDPMPVARYHSLIVTPQPGMERELAVNAVSDEGEVMALAHRRHPTYGIQFHPESVLTAGGHAIFANFCDWPAHGARRAGGCPSGRSSNSAPMLWYDERLVEGPVPFDLADRGLLLGDGVFDTALAIDGRVVFEEAHVARLAAAAQALGFAVEPARIVEAMRAVAAAAPRAAIRTTLTRGPGPRGIGPPAEPQPLLFASAAPARPGLAFQPLRLHVTEIRRNETSPASRLKTLGYLDAVLAAREAAAAGSDETLFLNTQGRVACAGTANFFAVIDGRIVTPPPSEGVLPGIVRGVILERALQIGLSVEERPLALAELGQAQAAFVTNSLRLVGPGHRDRRAWVAERGRCDIRPLALARREGMRARRDDIDPTPALHPEAPRSGLEGSSSTRCATWRPLDARCAGNSD